ncbi:MAG TPA: hypothetical protein PLA94_30400, partial [Myxococcota bacterium]|nr:hypothetical protein [Myxococcota bacterium]
MAGLPGPNDGRWKSTRPTNCVAKNTGATYIYAWVKDASGNVSAPFPSVLVTVKPNVAAIKLVTGGDNVYLHGADGGATLSASGRGPDAIALDSVEDWLYYRAGSRIFRVNLTQGDEQELGNLGGLLSGSLRALAVVCTRRRLYADSEAMGAVIAANLDGTFASQIVDGWAGGRMIVDERTGRLYMVRANDRRIIARAPDGRWTKDYRDTSVWKSVLDPVAIVVDALRGIVVVAGSQVIVRADLESGENPVHIDLTSGVPKGAVDLQIDAAAQKLYALKSDGSVVVSNLDGTGGVVLRPGGSNNKMLCVQPTTTLIVTTATARPLGPDRVELRGEVDWSYCRPGTCENRGYFFEYGPSTAYGSRINANEAEGTVVATLGGLTEATAYHFRLVVEYSSKPSPDRLQKAADDRAFTTLP